ncbi:hypothetical protein N5853_01430 [Bartonella sp. HY329]|uniref:hypothetical protein n=1 Tax=unclassified Bartonella TaxID=2645622 RepID=UPI0021C735C2|nr:MULTISPECIES: hypothetical protein [unclassified Bartonella]UXM95341.1 hypothetical protein N5853_01430 [Bartonella sp. HY329]UXN09666.1 hypothetical protein N5852_01435 [Bartonella sp. HY328]
MQEKNSFESCIPALSRVERLFNIVSFTIIACIIGAAITTYQYPKSQAKSFFWGGETLWQASFAPIIWIFFIALPAALAISFLFRHQYKIWRIGSYWMMVTSIIFGIFFAIMPVIRTIHTSLTQLFCGFSSAFRVLLLVENNINKSFNSCLAQNNVNLNQVYGLSIYLIYGAAIISFVTLSYLIIVKVRKK